jgi:hypothetical protein
MNGADFSNRPERPATGQAVDAGRVAPAAPPVVVMVMMEMDI